MILTRIERYLRRMDMAPSRFGREAVNDSALVLQLRAGRKLQERTERRVSAWLDARGA